MLKRLLDLIRIKRGLARRIYFAFLVAAVLPTAIAGIIGITLSLDALRQETLRNLSQEVSIRAKGLSMFFDQLSAELFFLAKAPALDDLRNAIKAGDPQRIRSTIARIEQDYSTLAAAYPYIYQIRFLSAEGRELVRVDKRDGKVIIVENTKLQDKSDRYYFREVIAHPVGALYVSPLDLNIEHGQVEQPERPVIRVAVAVGSGGGRSEGVLIVNLHADIVLSQIEQMASARKGTAYLFDQSGHYLSRSSGETAGFAMRPVAALESAFGEDNLKKLLGAADGTLSTGGSIVAHAAVEFGHAYAKTEGARWVIAGSFPERALFFSLFNLYMLYAVLAISLIVTAVGGYALSRRLLGPVDVLARETEAIAAGDFSRRVNISGDDEIADLGGKFNVMTDRLSGLYRTLEAHRHSLEDEVAARTRELNHERASLVAIIQHTGDGILVVSVTGLIVLANGAVRNLLGGSDEVIGLPVVSFWPDWPGIAEAVRPGDAVRREILNCGRILALTVTLTQEDGDRRSLVAVVRDVSEDRRLQDERRELDRQMFQMEKMATLGEIAMGLAHEIGNPLAGIKAVVQLLLDDDLGERQREYLTRAEDEINRLSEFLRTFHGFAAPQEMHPVACCLEQVLEDVMLWTRKEAKSCGVTISYAPCCERVPELLADPWHLKQLLLNLVINAIHAMPAGGAIRIGMCSGFVRHDEAGAEVPCMRFCVCDSGVGIAPDVQARIFDPFFTTRADGSGLGLAVVKKIALQHGADILVESAPGHGTCFELVWPIALAPIARSTNAGAANL